MKFVTCIPREARTWQGFRIGLAKLTGVVDYCKDEWGCIKWWWWEQELLPVDTGEASVPSCSGSYNVCPVFIGVHHHRHDLLLKQKAANQGSVHPSSSLLQQYWTSCSQLHWSICKFWQMLCKKWQFHIQLSWLEYPWAFNGGICLHLAGFCYCILQHMWDAVDDMLSCASLPAHSEQETEPLYSILCVAWIHCVLWPPSIGLSVVTLHRSAWVCSVQHARILWTCKQKTIPRWSQPIQLWSRYRYLWRALGLRLVGISYHWAHTAVLPLCPVLSKVAGEYGDCIHRCMYWLVSTLAPLQVSKVWTYSVQYSLCCLLELFLSLMIVLWYE